MLRNGSVTTLAWKNKRLRSGIHKEGAGCEMELPPPPPPPLKEEISKSVKDKI